VNHQARDARAEETPLAGLRIGGERVAAGVRIARRGDAQRREMPPRRRRETSLLNGTQSSDVPPQIAPQQVDGGPS
jgi:hypothetical protein